LQPISRGCSCIAFQRLYNIGTHTIEETSLSGDADNPFRVDRSEPFGAISADAVVFDGEQIYFIAEVTKLRKIVKTNGSTPVVISYGIDTILENMTAVENAKAFTFGTKGQNFACFYFPSANVVIDEQTYDAVTLAYHLQSEQWVILGKWDDDNGVYEPYRGISSCYIERYGQTLIGGRDGKLYQLTDATTAYTDTPQLLHRWRNDYSTKDVWSTRNIALYPIGDSKMPQDQVQGGQYRNRQHEFTFTNNSDAGEMFRAKIKTGYITHGTENKKTSCFYRYNVKRGVNDLIINSIHEKIKVHDR